jgi:uroporphyrinogen-III synthase
MAASLNGRVLAFVEARMPDEMASLVRRHGGVPYSAPVMQEIYLRDDPEVRQLVSDICGGCIDIVVLLTGVGTRALVETAASMGRQEEFIRALDGLTVVARSPKPSRVLRQHKVHIDIMPPEPYTSEDLVESIAGLDLKGARVAVQRYGGPSSFLLQSLKARDAQVREVTLYTWGLPVDRAPVVRLIDDLNRGEVSALAFTSQPQVLNLLTIARDVGKERELMDTLNGPVLVASVGPVCSRRLRESGIKIDVEPEHPHMGNLVMAVAEYWERQAGVG